MASIVPPHSSYRALDKPQSEPQQTNTLTKSDTNGSEDEDYICNLDGTQQSAFFHRGPTVSIIGTSNLNIPDLCHQVPVRWELAQSSC